MTRNITRRDAIKTAGAAVAPFIVPASVLGAPDAPPPSERITLGFIGIGMMGQGHLRGFLQYPDTQVVAVCDVDRWRVQNAQQMVRQHYATGQPSGESRSCQGYNDLRELLARDDIDATVIATGDNWHAAATVLAAKAGKDVYVEKPASLTIREARAMVDACQRYGRVGQVGLQQRSEHSFRKACWLVQQGRIGRIRDVYVGFPGTSDYVNLPPEAAPEGLDWDLWLGPAPPRPFNGRFHYYGRPPRVVPWQFCRDFGGGNLTSNAVHAFDVVQWGLGMDSGGPVEIVPPETGQVPALTFTYPNDVKLHVAWHLTPDKFSVPAGWDPATQLQVFGALFVGDDGWIHVGRQGYLQSYPAEIATQTELPDSLQPVGNHHQNWLQCIRSRAAPACDIAIGARSTMVSHLGCIAHWTRRALRWDPLAEAFLDDAGADRLRFRAMRPPWRIG